MCLSTSHPSGLKGMTFMLVFAIFSAVLGMFQFGYNTSVINAPQKIIQEFIGTVYKARTGKEMNQSLSDFLWGLTVSVFCVGGIVGGVGGGTLADKCGRKRCLLINNAVAILGGGLMALSRHFSSIECLIFGRFFIGLSCGTNTAIVPMYVSEIAPISLRGALGTVGQLATTIGLLLGQLLGLSNLLGSASGWPFLLGVTIVPAILQLLLLPMCPESPRYLLLGKNQLQQARSALKLLRRSNIEADIEEMRSEEGLRQNETKLSVLQIFHQRELFTPMVISIIMQLSQQLSGITVIFYYSTRIFTSTGLKEEIAQFANIAVGVIMVVVTVVSIPLMDRAGRRTLMLWGVGGMFITSIFFTSSLLVQTISKNLGYLSVVSSLAFVVLFAIGPGSIPWLITSELFSQASRSAAMTIATVINWSTNFLVSLSYPTIQSYLKNYSFLPFTIFLGIFWVYTYLKVPETKNKTLEEIAALFQYPQDETIDIGVRQENTEN